MERLADGIAPGPGAQVKATPPSGGRDPVALQQKCAAAERLLTCCRLCEFDCRVDRTRSELGRCGCDDKSYCYLESLLWGEEQFITPSYAIFFAGCNLRCGFCYADKINRRPQDYQPVDIAAIAARAGASEAASFSLIGGEPTVHLPSALRLAALLPHDLPIVWNSNFYFSAAGAALLAGVIDTYIADLHFGNDACAQRIAGAPRYLEVVGRNLKWAAGQGALVVRQLALPGHLECCTRPALEWLAAELPGTPLHLMTDYLPPEYCEDPMLRRSLSESEATRARELAQELGLTSVE